MCMAARDEILLPQLTDRQQRRRISVQADQVMNPLMNMVYPFESGSNAS